MKIDATHFYTASAMLTTFRTGDEWCIYPMYDFAHCLSDYIEGVTHSICTLEFENNRDIYDWVLDALDLTPPRPYQHELCAPWYELHGHEQTQTLGTRQWQLCQRMG